MWTSQTLMRNVLEGEPGPHFTKIRKSYEFVRLII